MLRLLVQQLSRLNLCTIDSLFAQIAATSTFELGVSGFSMIDTTAEKLARREAPAHPVPGMFPEPGTGAKL